jgi:hypothetical protein
MPGNLQARAVALHYNLLHKLSPKTDALLKAIDAELARP